MEPRLDHLHLGQDTFHGVPIIFPCRLLKSKNKEAVLSFREHRGKVHRSMQQADEKNLILPQLIENQIAVKSGHAETSEGGLLQIFPPAANFRLTDNQFQRFGHAVLKTDGKGRRDFAGKARDDFSKVVFKNRTEDAFHLAAARALAAMARSRASVPGREEPARPSSIIF